MNFQPQPKTTFTNNNHQDFKIDYKKLNENQNKLRLNTSKQQIDQNNQTNLYYHQSQNALSRSTPDVYRLLNKEIMTPESRLERNENLIRTIFHLSKSNTPTSNENSPRPNIKYYSDDEKPKNDLKIPVQSIYNFAQPVSSFPSSSSSINLRKPRVPSDSIFKLIAKEQLQAHSVFHQK